MKKINNKLWLEFIKWGSGFTLDAERDYKAKEEPLIYHLRLYGLWWYDKEEFVGKDINKVIKEALRVGRKNFKKHEKAETNQNR